jgi:putative transposase
LDEVFVKINGKLCHLWRAVDHEGEVLETVVTAKRDKAAALKSLKRIMKKYGRPRIVVTDGLCSWNVISSPARITNRDARLRWPNGAQSSPDPHLEFSLVAPNVWRVQSVPILSDKAF